jgi:Na+-driven multidrug efflux pump
MVYGWLPVSARREDNFIAGLSMGGRGTIKYAVNHPERFAAAAVLSGNAFGAGSRGTIRRLGRSLVLLEVLLMLLSGTLLFLLADPLVRIFTADPEVIRLGTTVLKMVAVSEPFYGVPIVLEGMMQGAGQTMLPLIFNVSCMWGVRICGTFVCTGMLGLGLTSAWGCMIAHNLMLFLLFSICWLRGRWMPGSPLQEKEA